MWPGWETGFPAEPEGGPLSRHGLLALPLCRPGSCCQGVSPLGAAAPMCRPGPPCTRRRGPAGTWPVLTARGTRVESTGCSQSSTPVTSRGSQSGGAGDSARSERHRNVPPTGPRAAPGARHCRFRPVLIRIFYTFFYMSHNSSSQTITQHRTGFKDLQEWEFD